MARNLNGFFFVVLAYFACSIATMAIVMPIQRSYFPAELTIFSLLFLPHGARMLSVYFFGWRGAIYLLVPSYAMWFLEVHFMDVNLHILGPAISACSCYLGVVTCRLGTGVLFQEFSFKEWRVLLASGAIASLFNAIGNAALYQEFATAWTVVGYMIGDVFGQFAVMVILIFTFRRLRSAN